MKINSYSYSWKGKKWDDHKEAGLLAQEVAAVLPHLVATNENGTLGVNYASLVPYLLEAVKQLSERLQKAEAILSNQNQPLPGLAQ